MERRRRRKGMFNSNGRSFFPARIDTGYSYRKSPAFTDFRIDLESLVQTTTPVKTGFNACTDFSQQ